MMKSSRPTLVFFALVAYLVLVKVLLALWPGVFRSPAQAAVFGWPWLLLWAALGWVGVVLSERTGFADPWNGEIPNRQRVLIPLLLGVVFGVLAIGVDLLTGWSDLVARKMGIASIHISFPASAIVYPGGAIIVEILYRLFPLSLLVWLVSNMLLRGRRQTETFWAAAIVLSTIEPLGDIGLKTFGLATMTAVFAEDYALNLTQAYLFRRLGFLAAVLMRVVFYVVWHVLWGLRTPAGIG
jgi:hypothetical protein